MLYSFAKMIYNKYSKLKGQIGCMYILKIQLIETSPIALQASLLKYDSSLEQMSFSSGSLRGNILLLRRKEEMDSTIMYSAFSFGTHVQYFNAFYF